MRFFSSVATALESLCVLSLGEDRGVDVYVYVYECTAPISNESSLVICMTVDHACLGEL